MRRLVYTTAMNLSALLYLSDLVATSCNTHELGSRIWHFAYFLFDNSWDLRLGEGQTLLVQWLDSQVKTALSQSWLHFLFRREIRASHCNAYFSILTDMADGLLWSDSPASLHLNIILKNSRLW